MLSFILAFFTFGLGVKAFTRTGLPLSRTKNLTGTGAKVIGVLCILLALFLVVDGVLSVQRQMRMLNG